jgi:hypothetical protein
VRDGEIDDILKRAAEGMPEVDPAVVNRASAALRDSISPVRPLPPEWLWRGGLFAICAAVAVAGGWFLGPRGIQKMNALEIGTIFPVLSLLTWMAAVACVAAVTPGSRRPMPPRMLATAACVALAIVFGLLFTDYAAERFVAQGMKCLIVGMAHAIPVSIGAALLLHRGYAVDARGAWVAKGTLAGLAGVAMLELHCANFEAPHVLVWHVAVLALSALLGAAIGWMLSRGWS